MSRQSLNRRTLAILVLCTVSIVGVGSTALAAGFAATSTLQLRAELAMQSRPGVCPPGTDVSIECRARTGVGVVPGLGRVSETYDFVVQTSSNGCSTGEVTVLASTARFSSDKGTIDLAMGPSSGCYLPEASLNASRSFTITGGSGAFTGASGGGQLKHHGYYTDAGAAGVDAWTGDFSVPGLEFDTTAPVLTGAANKTVRAKKGATSARAVYQVTAKDETDGARPVACTPKSGSKFKRGKTRVTCATSDNSGNVAQTSFTVTVRR